MNRGRQTTGGYPSPRGPSSRSAGHPSHSNPHTHMTGADGSFSDGSLSSRGGHSHGRRGSGRISPGSSPGYSNQKHGPVYEYWKKKSSRNESFQTEGFQQNQNASNASGSESEQSESFVASNAPNGCDSALLSTCSSSQETQLDIAKVQVDQKPVNVDRGNMHHDFSHEVKISPLLTESQPSFQSGAKDQLSQQQCAKSAESTGDPGHSDNLTVIQPFDICTSRTGIPVLKPSLHEINRQKRNDTKRALEGQGKVLEPGMILLKGYLSIDDQVKIVKLCRSLGLGPGGFYQPGYHDGAKLQLKMMCLGKNWDPNTSKYGECRPVDGAKPPDIPHEFRLLVERAMKDAYALLGRNCEESIMEDILPGMSPDICVVNFYSASGRLGLHQDKDESEGSLKKGLPVVSFSIGDTGEFLYGDTRDEKNAKKVLLESGDVLIFGGKSRHIFHGVCSVRTETAPKSLLQETNLRTGRLNLTFRKY